VVSVSSHTYHEFCDSPLDSAVLDMIRIRGIVCREDVDVHGEAGAMERFQRKERWKLKNMSRGKNEAGVG
jgi:hypothetical protein